MKPLRPSMRLAPAAARATIALLTISLLAAACGSSSGSGSTTPTDPGNAGSGDAAPLNAEPVAVLGSDADRADANPDAPIDELSTGFNNAGFDLIRSQPIADNLVLSPMSIGHALLLARGAADDPTAASIDAALSLPPGLDAHDAWNTLDLAIEASNGASTDINGDPTPIVSIADRIWPKVGLEPSADWLDILARYHGADVQPIDVSQAEASRQIINNWVSDNTETLIPELLPEGFIDADTALVLTDAVYFKAQWATIFGKYGEVTAPFHLLDGSTVSVSLMTDLEQPGGHVVGDGFSAAELPYRGDQYSMLLLVPHEGQFESFRENLDDDFVRSVDEQLVTGPWELQMPQWETTSALDLIPWLTEIGAAPGNYPGIAEGIFLDGAVHGADIAVDDIGTVAAAATALGFNESGAGEPDITITVDRPFFYVVRHVESGLVLFTGQVLNPLG